MGILSGLFGCNDKPESSKPPEDATKQEERQKQMEEARLAGDKTMKPYLIPAAEMQELTLGMGACYVTDRILVDGVKVGYMYREEPDFDEDSGWRFLAGDESNEYMDDQWNTGIVDLNTVSNYDRSIIPLLKSPIGSAFARTSVTGKLQPVEAPDPE